MRENELLTLVKNESSYIHVSQKYRLDNEMGAPLTVIKAQLKNIWLEMNPYDNRMCKGRTIVIDQLVYRLERHGTPLLELFSGYNPHCIPKSSHF